MSDESTGFASPSEGEAAGPFKAFERSPMKVLESLSGKPLQQAMKAIEYIDATHERQRKYLRVCSPKALALIAENGPEYLSATRAAAE
jgi:hypothetical protein